MVLNIAIYLFFFSAPSKSQKQRKIFLKQTRTKYFCPLYCLALETLHNPRNKNNLCNRLAGLSQTVFTRSYKEIKLKMTINCRLHWHNTNRRQTIPRCDISVSWKMHYNLLTNKLWCWLVYLNFKKHTDIT